MSSVPSHSTVTAPATILAIDPGTKHLAYCVMRQGRIVESATLQPVRQIKGARTEHVLRDIRAFSREFGRLLDRVTPDCCAIERFMYRPGLGLAGEFINVMLGKLIDKCDHRKIEVLLVMPAQHKTWIRKVHGCDPPAYKPFAKLGSEHECDAASIALFTKQEWYDRSHELLAQAEAAALLPKKKPRRKPRKRK